MKIIKELKGKTIKKVENNNTDICIYFTDGSFLGIDAAEDTYLSVNFTNNE